MQEQVLVIGLGQFGMAFARALASHGHDVLAVDRRDDRIADIAPHVTEAVVSDAIDEETLNRLAPAQRDVCVCAIGDEDRESSIIVTALLRQLGAKRIVARATSDLHARILKMVGADEIVNPEQSYGERMALRISWPQVREMVPLGGDLFLVELRAPEALWGRKVSALAALQREGVTVHGVRRRDASGDGVELLREAVVLQEDDVLFFAAARSDIAELLEGLA